MLTRTVSKLSTPSLGITGCARVSGFHKNSFVSFNSLSRDHYAVELGSIPADVLSTPSLGITLPAELHQRLRAIAFQLGLTFNSLSRDHERLRIPEEL
jgi:hypothetical protein